MGKYHITVTEAWVRIDTHTNPNRAVASAALRDDSASKLSSYLYVINNEANLKISQERTGRKHNPKTSFSRTKLKE